MDACPFRESPSQPCPIPLETTQAELVEPCFPGEYGERCGQILAQNLLARMIDVETFTCSLDEQYGRYDAYFCISAPDPEQIEGPAPRSVRIALDGIELPLRSERPQPDDGSVYVLHADIVLGLLDSGRIEAAAWYNQEVSRLNRSRPDNAEHYMWWAFAGSNGNVRPDFSTGGTPTTEALGHVMRNGFGEPLRNTLMPSVRLVRSIHDAQQAGIDINDTDPWKVIY
ncbi:MAG: hypothetical protein JWN82_75 [Candidatus Saccharibacteria bacterium]|nr:hypothetical protein [Candidatus Saccharibacteria bacterium]